MQGNVVLLARLSSPLEVVTSIRREVPKSQIPNARSGFYAQADRYKNGKLYILTGKDRKVIAEF